MSLASFRVVTSLDEWRQLASELDGLLEQFPGRTALQSCRFLNLWWQHLGGDKSLYILVSERNGQLSGFVPLQLRRQTILGKRYRILEFLGMPDELLRPALVFPSEPRESLAGALDQLWKRRNDWDLLQLDELVLNGDAIDQFERFAAKRRLLLRRTPFHPCPYLDLRQDWQSYMATRSRKLRKNIRNLRNRLERAGTLTTNTVTEPGDMRAALDDYVAIERRSWKPDDAIGVGKSKAYRDFYAALLESYAQTGQARILFLRLDDRHIAATIAIQESGHYYSLQITHDNDFANYSPGTVLESLELQELMEEQRFERYEFFGGALANKQRWSDTSIETERLLLHQRDWRMVAFDGWYFRLKPRLKRGLRRIGAYR